jgi:hypothetical protein
MINVDDVLYWISYGKSNTVGIWKLDGYTPVKISNKAIDDKIVSLFNAGFANYCYINTFMCSSKKHIGVAGIGRTVMPYLADTSQLPDALLATWNLSYFQGIQVNYCVDDKTWWYLAMSNSNPLGIQPFTLFNRTNTSTYKQYFMRGDSMKVWAFSISGLGVDIEDDGVTSEPVIATIQLSTLDFSTERRKRINKIKPIFQGLSAYPTPNQEFFALVYDKTNEITMNSLSCRGLDAYQPTFRYYWNNFGMCRFLNLAFVDVTTDPMELKAIELDLAQGTA